jgi:hypothetical protein
VAGEEAAVSVLLMVSWTPGEAKVSAPEPPRQDPGLKPRAYL